MIDNLISILDRIRSKESFVKGHSFVSDIIFCDVISVPITKFLSKFKFVSPNLVTVIAFTISLIAAYIFTLDTPYSMMYGAIVMYFANVLDGVDGKLARLTKQFSDFGAKLDKTADSVRKLFALGALVYVSSSFNSAVLIGMIVLHYLLNYIPYTPHASYLEKCHSHGIKSLFEPWDAMFLLLVWGPFFNSFPLFVGITIALQLVNIFYFRLTSKSTPIA